jgi:hypothetical protein
MVTLHGKVTSTRGLLATQTSGSCPGLLVKSPASPASSPVRTFSRSAGSVTGRLVAGRSAGRGLLQVKGEPRMGDEVGVPVAGTSGGAGDVVPAVEAVKPDLDPAWFTGLASGGGDVDDPGVPVMLPIRLVGISR